uniref:PIR2-like helical domain-containing protein n=1 Tax=Setaria italica TaxID=4555 RepID=K3YDB3_SETIT
MASNHLPVCCCGDSGIDREDPHQALLDTICGFYVEALDRLPIRDYPNPIHCLSVAGHCYGLLEPVSNVILHATGQGPYKREDITTEFLDKMHSSWYWQNTAERSLDGLTTFLMSGYRYLTLEQAVGYLYLAKADIYLAMDLVEREFDTQCLVEEALLPSFDDDAWILTIKDSLMYAAMAAEHPNPDRLVALATETFVADHVDRIAAWLRTDQLCKVAVDDIYSSLKYGRAPDGRYLYNLRLSYPDTDDAVVPVASCQNLNTCTHRCSSLLKDQQAGWDSEVSPCDYG